MKNSKLLLNLTLFLILAFVSGTAIAQSANEVYTDRNVRIIQHPDGWQVMHFDAIVAHGNGTLDIKNLPPAFQDFLDIYATMPKSQSSKKSISKSTSYTYGPFLKTQWNQYPPYNDLCPTKLAKQEDGSMKEQRTLTGCVQISSGQILNYYKYCKTINKNDFITQTEEFASMSDIFGLKKTRHEVFGDQNYYEYSYEINNYTPDFSKINSDYHELAKFIYALGLIQDAYYGVEGTSAPTSVQLDAFNKIYGYKADYYDLSSMTDNARIENSIKKGCPVIISGSKANDDGHSFIIDGYNTYGEFHVNYGWGGSSDGWFTKTTYPYKLNIIIAQPATEDFATMQMTPTALHIKGQGIDKDFQLQFQNGINYTGDIDLAGGEYEFYFKYSNGNKIAPYTNGVTIALTKSENKYAKRGMFSNQPAKFKIANAQTVNFSHNPCLNEISLKVTDFEVLVSGNVIDANGKAIANAIITTAKNKPSLAIESETENNTGSFYQSHYFNDAYLYSQAFQLQKKYIDAIEFCVGIRNTPKDLTVAILDKNKEVLWQKSIASTAFESGEWTKVYLDNPLEIVPGDNYFFALYNTGSNTSHMYFFYVDDNRHAIYRVWTSNDKMAHSDSKGNYSLIVDKGFSGNLYAYSDKYTFAPLTLSSVTNELKNQNFAEKVKQAVSIAIATKPTKTEYISGSSLSLEGGIIQVSYDNYTSENVALNKAIVTGFDTNTPGVQTITVEYLGLKTTFNVTVIERAITKVEMLELPTFREYITGEPLEVAGGALTAYYNDNTTEIVPFDLTEVTGFDTNKIGKQTLTVEYAGFTFKYDVTVEADPTTATESITARDAKIWAYGNTIVVENGSGEISIVDMSGRTIETVKANNEHTEITMQKSGVYIIKSGLTKQKVIIK